MKKYALLILVHVACAFTLFWVACSSPPPGNKLQGSWKSKDGSTKLKITDKKFITDDGQSVTEDYFVKGDTIFTSFEGNKPYTVFLVQKLDENSLKLMGPDSVAMDYVR